LSTDYLIQQLAVGFLGSATQIGKNLNNSNEFERGVVHSKKKDEGKREKERKS